jgi:hypothetical protein
MKGLEFARKLSCALAVGACLLLATAMMAQVKSETTTTQGQPTVETKTQRGEVVHVSGNDLLVKTEDGELKLFSNVPDSVKVDVDGQQLSIHELKPGMKLQRTITTTTTPQTVQTVQTVNGTVWSVNAPRSVILTLEDGTNQQFRIPEGQKFSVNGEEVDAFHLKKGMRISATRVVTVPESVVAEHRAVTGEMPDVAAIQTMPTAMLIVVPPASSSRNAASENAQVAEATPHQMPQTASELPAIGVLGFLALLAGLVPFALRTRAQQGR